MLNNFIYAETKDLFIAQLQAGNVLDEAIVFIEDTKEIWNHGTYFGGNKTDLSDLDTTNLATKEDLSNYLPLTGGTITGDLITTMTLEGNAIIGSDAYISQYWNNNNTAYIRFFDDFEIKDKNDNKLVSITYKGDGTKFLSDDGSYKTIEASGNSASAYAEVNHGTSDTTFTLTPNTFHVWDKVTSLDLSFADEQAGVANEYLFQFTSGATATTLTLPDVKWANDIPPIIAKNMIYQISVLKGLGVWVEF